MLEIIKLIDNLYGAYNSCNDNNDDDANIPWRERGQREGITISHFVM